MVHCACDCHEGQWPWVERRQQPRWPFSLAFKLTGDSSPPSPGPGVESIASYGAMEHAAVELQTIHDAENNTWGGSLLCSCGWGSEISGYRRREQAAIGLQTAWFRHSG